MEGPDDEIRRMDIFQTMSLVRTRDLLPLANQLVWERLVQLGLYDGNPNPEVPPEYRYTRSKILSMERDTDNFVEVLGLLPQVKQMVIDSQKIQFSDLPPEVLVNILGRVSPTAREGTLVSRDMKELADIALMNNIRTNNLVDPTIGIAYRNQYFKVDAGGNGEYFSPKPGLWRELKASRELLLRRDELLFLFYGQLMDKSRNPIRKIVAIVEKDAINLNDYRILPISTRKSFLDLSTIESNPDIKPIKIVLDITDLVPPSAGYSSESVVIDDNWLTETFSNKPQPLLQGYYNNPTIDSIDTVNVASTHTLLLGNLIPLNRNNVQRAQVILPSIRDDVRII